MGSRTCEVWAIRTDLLGKIQDRVRYGHVKHVCIRTREFAQEHQGDHECSCGLIYARSETDND